MPKHLLDELPVQEREQKRQKLISSLSIQLNHVDCDGDDVAAAKETRLAAIEWLQQVHHGLVSVLGYGLEMFSVENITTITDWLALKWCTLAMDDGSDGVCVVQAAGRICCSLFILYASPKFYSFQF